MDVFDLYAKISLDTKGYEQGISNAKSSIGGFKSSLGTALKDIAKIATAAVTAGATAAGKIVKDATSQYGEYQQLVGGIETLFQGSADKVQANAEKAFSAAQISANEYMDLVTSFSASLIQSTGRGIQTNLSDLKESQKEQLKATKQTYADELKEEKARWDAKIKFADKSQKESLRSQKDAAIDSLKKQQTERLALLEKSNKKALEDAEKANSQSTTSAQSLEKAAKLSDLAVIDMADNANKMGTNMQSIQNAYQGFAKQNYTMLDNLKLGYGGTKTEMERLLKDADALNAKQGKYTKYSINSFADIVEAIHVVQQNLGITGTSAEEASTTISGSLGSVKASWKDLLTAMGSGKGIDKPLKNFTESVKKFGTNIKPTLEDSLKGVTELVKELAPAIAEEVPKLIVEVAPTLISAGAEMVGALASGVFDALDKSHFDETAGKLTEKANEIIGNWDTESSATKFSDILNKVINAGFNITSTFDFKQAAEKLTNWCNNAVNNLDVQKLGETVSHAWKGAWDFIGTALEEIDWENVGNKISEFINSVDWAGILTSMFNAIGNLIKAMPELLKGVIEKLDFASAASFLAVLFAPKIATSLASNLLTEFKTNKSARGILTSAGQEAGNTLGSGAGSTANSLGTSWASTFSIAIKAFLAGWSIGTWIYNTWKDEIDAAAEKLLDGTMLGQTIKFATGEQTAINATNEQRKTIEKTLQKYEDMGFKVNWDTKDVDAELVRLRSLQYDAMEKGTAITHSQAVANQQEARRNINSPYDYKIYLDTGKIVGGTSAARGAQYNYTKKGYAT